MVLEGKYVSKIPVFFFYKWVVRYICIFLHETPVGISRTAILNSFLRFVLVSPRTKPLLSFSGLLRPSETIEIIDVGLSHQVQSFYHRFLEKHYKKRVVGKFKKLLLTLNIFLLITVWSPVKEMDSFSNSLVYQSLSRRLRMFAERVTYLRLTLHFEHHTWQHGLMPKTMLKMFHHAQFNDLKQSLLRVPQPPFPIPSTKTAKTCWEYNDYQSSVHII